MSRQIFSFLWLLYCGVSMGNIEHETIAFICDDGNHYFVYKQAKMVEADSPYAIPYNISVPAEDNYSYINPDAIQIDSSNNILIFPNGFGETISRGALNPAFENGEFIYTNQDTTSNSANSGDWIRPGNFRKYVRAWVFPDQFEITSYACNKKGTWEKRNNTIIFRDENVNNLVFRITYRVSNGKVLDNDLSNNLSFSTFGDEPYDIKNYKINSDTAIVLLDNNTQLKTLFLDGIAVGAFIVRVPNGKRQEDDFLISYHPFSCKLKMDRVLNIRFAVDERVDNGNKITDFIEFRNRRNKHGLLSTINHVITNFEQDFYVNIEDSSSWAIPIKFRKKNQSFDMTLNIFNITGDTEKRVYKSKLCLEWLYVPALFEKILSHPMITALVGALAGALFAYLFSLNRNKDIQPTSASIQPSVRLAPTSQYPSISEIK